MGSVETLSCPKEICLVFTLGYVYIFHKIFFEVLTNRKITLLYR